MADLPPGLPPIPRSLKGLLNVGSAQWKETERIHALRTSIQEDLTNQSSNGHHAYQNGSPRRERPTITGTQGLQAALTHLRRDMVGPRIYIRAPYLLLRPQR